MRYCQDFQYLYACCGPFWSTKYAFDGQCPEGFHERKLVAVETQVCAESRDALERLVQGFCDGKRACYWITEPYEAPSSLRPEDLI